jgi:NAD(P)-dependent dehydrogenase (short-subunit alcohol dehydrogenase family)
MDGMKLKAGQVADETIERFGRVDLVCNNAGVVCEQAPTWKQRAETGLS